MGASEERHEVSDRQGMSSQFSHDQAPKKQKLPKLNKR
jgi:hypothetical protein